MSLRIAIVGGGPGGLYLACLCKQLDPAHEITVWERNDADDTFGFGVVFSDETLGGIRDADPLFAAAMEQEFARWDDIDVHYRGEVITSGGHRFAAMSRRRLLQLLQARAKDLGVRLHFRSDAPPVEELSATHDLVVAADGVNSGVRTQLAGVFGPSGEQRRCRFMWLATSRVFEAFTFDVRETEWGVMQAHAYPYDTTGSTFIVEMHDDVWQRAGFATLAAEGLRPGESDHASIGRVREIFADLLDGHDVHANNSKWISFTTVRNERWSAGNVVLLGDAAHTAHFSIGSGTKLALEDALALAACLHEEPDVLAALATYEQERRPVVVSTQRAAQASLEWFENLGQYTHQDPLQFAFNIMTRSRRVTYDNLRLRDPEFVAAVDAEFAKATSGEARPPMFQPFRLRGLELRNRVVVSPMDMYSAEDGVPGDFHLVHLGSKAMGGAGLVMTEMVCVSPEARITPGCTGLWNDEQEQSFARIVDFVHQQTGAAIGLQLGHAGRKGATKLMWEGMDEPLPSGDWPVVAPSPLPYTASNQVPRQLTREDMDTVRELFVASALRGARAGFDLLEVHCAHGYLLSSFLSPLTNVRDDEYGGTIEGRLRFPLEVVEAVRAVWPDDRPLSVRISATDWHDGGNDVADAVVIARALASAGVDAVDVSTGQVVSEERPAYGRSYQTPYADRIRNELALAGIEVATIAVGAISSYDDVNSLVLAGRADLCALGRPHLYDPLWTLHAAAEQGYAGAGVRWPLPFAAGSRPPPSGRTDGPKPRLDLLRSGPTGTAHGRWRPQPKT